MLMWIALSRLFTVCGLCGKGDELRCFIPETILKCLTLNLLASTTVGARINP